VTGEVGGEELGGLEKSGENGAERRGYDEVAGEVGLQRIVEEDRISERESG